jgi:hypothetical protein
MKTDIQISANELIDIAQKRLGKLKDANRARLIENAWILYSVYDILGEIETALTPTEKEKIEKFRKELVHPFYLDDEKKKKKKENQNDVF